MEGVCRHTLLRCETLTPFGVEVRVPYSGRVLPATVPCGARTFLHARLTVHSGCLASFARHFTARNGNTSHFRPGCRGIEWESGAARVGVQHGRERGTELAADSIRARHPERQSADDGRRSDAQGAGNLRPREQAIPKPFPAVSNPRYPRSHDKLAVRYHAPYGAAEWRSKERRVRRETLVSLCIVHRPRRLPNGSRGERRRSTARRISWRRPSWTPSSSRWRSVLAR
jgi:hypothetical protein